LNDTADPSQGPIPSPPIGPEDNGPFEDIVVPGAYNVENIGQEEEEKEGHPQVLFDADNATSGRNLNNSMPKPSK
jgi:hypothetical protein